jgi:hypothetical protein
MCDADTRDAEAERDGVPTIVGCDQLAHALDAHELADVRQTAASADFVAGAKTPGCNLSTTRSIWVRSTGRRRYRHLRIISEADNLTRS